MVEYDFFPIFCPVHFACVIFETTVIAKRSFHHANIEVHTNLNQKFMIWVK